jgi:aminoglycoside 6'-N-acetyltransferase
VTISFRALRRSDLPLLERWLSEPHVEAWWHTPLDLATLHEKYGPRIDGIEPTHVYVIEYDERSIGWIQWYRWSDYPGHASQLGAPPDAAGIDLAIGEPEMLGRGLGAHAIRRFVENVVFVDRAITACVSDPDERNVRSLRAFEKAGFIAVRSVRLAGEQTTRRVVRLERA